MKINGGKSRKRKAEYWLALSFAWIPSVIVDCKHESRVNDNRHRARILGKYGIYGRKKTGKHEYGLPAKYLCSWRQKTYRKLCRLWHKLPHVKIKWGGRHNKGSKTL